MSTTDPNLKSFIPVDPDSHFPIQNLPYGVFRHKDGGTTRVGVAIGEYVLDLSVLQDKGYFTGPELQDTEVFKESSLNDFMAMGRAAWTEARNTISHLLNENTPDLRDNTDLRDKALIKQDDVILEMPVEIGDYTDFYASRYHATNVGTMFRGPDNALQPNYLHLPVGYHGRASSIVLSGTDINRPKGQIVINEGENPVFAPCRLLDYELEMGFFVGPGNELGKRIPIEKTSDHIFGMVLVNDWSARDIQKWEYVPLGPFLAKNFATSISPWVVTLDALEPFKTDALEQDPRPLEYLQDKKDSAFDINLEVAIKSARMEKPQTIVKSNLKHMYWSIFQQLAHHTATGCNMQPGDMLATGTISGPEKESRGCLLEQTWKGSEPVELENGETRKFLADGDTVIMSSYCQGNGFKVGFGQVSGTVLPSID